MRFYRRADDAVLYIPNPRVRFFLLGPLYLLWLRLWKEAALTAVGVWGLVHGAIVLTRALTGVSTRLTLESAFAAIDALQDAAKTGVSADVAFRNLFESLLPFVVASATLLGVMTVLTALLPRYLEWRFAGRGWRPLDEAGVEQASPIYGI